jgi:IS5 family transposase
VGCTARWLTIHLRPPIRRLQTHQPPPGQVQVGIEGRISHLKRRYGLRRSRLKRHHGTRTWTAWAILADNLDTLAIRTR